ncbi:MAG: hypothetical protein IAE79_04290 [Anaerolinea sp.]|nr:hypothetical protein [Anaerolinea sp.]
MSPLYTDLGYYASQSSRLLPTTANQEQIMKYWLLLFLLAWQMGCVMVVCESLP